MDTITLKENIDALGHVFHEFKEGMEERFTMLEKKGAVDPLIEEKVNRLNEELEKAQERVILLEKKSRRPEVQEIKASQSSYGKAFVDYIRKGFDHGLEQKALSSEPGTEGGYLIPTYIQDQMIKVLSSPLAFRSLARVTNISTDAVEILVDKEELDAGWVLEKAERPETGMPTLTKLKIPVHEIYAKPRATQKLLDDAQVNVEEWLSEKIGEKFLKIENQAFINGDGEQKPKGFLAYESVEKDDWEWGRLEHIKTGKIGGFEERRGADVLFEVVEALKSQYLNGACWVMSRLAHQLVRTLKDANRNYLWQPGLALGMQPTLLGYPVTILEEMPGLDEEEATSAIAFGNFKEGYQVVDRVQMHVLRDPYSAKPYVEFYATKRVGGDVVNFEAIKIVRFEA